MAQKTYTLNVDVNAPSISELESQLEQVNAELKDLDRNSDAFKAAAKDAQALNAQLEKTNNVVAGLQLEDKLQAADGAIKVLGGSLSAVVGTLGVLGVESEVFGEFEEKAASAIAVGMGIKDVSEGFGQFSKVMKKSGIAAKLFGSTTSKALIATGVGAFVVLLGAIVANWDAISSGVKKFIDSSEGLTKFFNNVKAGFNSIFESIRPVLEFFGLYPTLEEEQVEAARKGAEERSKSTEKELKLAQARGASAQELADIEKRLLEEKLKAVKTDEEAAEAQFQLDLFYNREQKRLAGERSARLQKELADKKAAADKAATDAAKAAEKEAKDAEDKKNKAIQAAKDLEALRKEIRDAEANTEEERRQLELTKIEENYTRLIEMAKENGLETGELEATLNETLAAKQKEYDDADVAAAEDKAARLKAVSDKEISDRLAAKEAQVAIENAKWNLLSQAASVATQLAEDNEAVAIGAVIATQAAAIGQIISSTGLANAKAVAASPITGGMPWVAINSISAGLSITSAVASGIKSIKDIKNSKNGGSGAGGGGMKPPQGRRGSVQAPATNIETFNAPQQLTATPTVRAYVVSGDVSSSQEAAAKLSAKRTLS